MISRFFAEGEATPAEVVWCDRLVSFFFENRESKCGTLATNAAMTAKGLFSAADAKASCIVAQPARRPTGKPVCLDNTSLRTTYSQISPTAA